MCIRDRVNVGTTKRVEMKRVKVLFESLGYTNVSTYINSGNVIFETDQKQAELRDKIEQSLKKEFGFDILSLVRSDEEMKTIVRSIPEEWQNDSIHRTDVAYLFPEIDSEATLEELPINKDYIDIRYIKGALFWNIERVNVNKSRLNKLVGHRLIQLMTIRNINTARYLAGHK